MIVTVLLICMIERKCINAHGPYVFNLYDRNKLHKGHMGAYVLLLYDRNKMQTHGPLRFQFV